MKTPKEQTIEFIMKKVEKEKDKWNTGFGTNHYQEWQNFSWEFFSMLTDCATCKRETLDMLRSYDNKISRLKSILEKYGIKEIE